MSYSGLSLRQWLLRELARLVPLTTGEISLYLLKHRRSIVYRSHLPVQMDRHNPGAIAQSLLKSWIHPDVQLQVTTNFALDFLVSDRLVALWLDYHLSLIPHPPSLFSFQIHPQFFPLQYSHARCCAYLRQLQLQGVITPSGSIPCLQPYPLVLTRLLPCLNPPDKDLLISLLCFLDSSSEHYLSSINNLALALLNFERYGGIWRNKHELLGFRALLLLLTQSNLQIALETQLQVTAPKEL